MDLQLLSILLGQLAIIGGDPALGYRGQAITQALALLSVIVTKGGEARKELGELSVHVAEMVEKNREPTKSEWNSFRELSKGYHDVLNPPPPEEPEGEPVMSTDEERAEFVEGVTRHMR